VGEIIVLKGKRQLTELDVACAEAGISASV